MKGVFRFAFFAFVPNKSGGRLGWSSGGRPGGIRAGHLEGIRAGRLVTGCFICPPESSSRWSSSELPLDVAITGNGSAVLRMMSASARSACIRKNSKYRRLKSKLLLVMSLVRFEKKFFSRA